MGDGLKLPKDKRHRSSSSLAGVLEGTRSERKLDARASIPEVDDQFALAEARCDELQDKIDLVKGLKKKRKLKKRSMTRVAELPTVENVPFISVHTQPKKKVSPQTARLRRLEVPGNPTRAYLDPATLEQHRMLRGYHQHRQTHLDDKTKSKHSNLGLMPLLRNPKSGRERVEGGDNVRSAVNNEVACGNDEVIGNDSENEVYNQFYDDFSITVNKKQYKPRMLKKPSPAWRRKQVIKEHPDHDSQWAEDATAEAQTWQGSNMPIRRCQPHTSTHAQSDVAATNKHTERPVVELFNKCRPAGSMGARPAFPRVASTEKNLNNTSWHAGKQKQQKNNRVRENVRRHSPARNESVDSRTIEDEQHVEIKKEKAVHRHPQRVRYRSRRYELPTVASQMKQAGVRYYQGTANRTNIPFIVSKSTAPSHNIGVNIQQVLNGLKIQQPLSGIPFTIAYHMGLGYIPNYTTKSSAMQQQPCLDAREMNAIRLGRKLVRLPSYKYMSYSRLLSLYREGDGMVPRFLRSISRPHYFYTSMYNLATRDDFDGATSKGRGANHEAKQSLAEYASLYRQYEQLDRCQREGSLEPDLERRKDELTRELAAREQHIRKVVQDFRTGEDVEQAAMLRASASTAGEDHCRHSALTLNLGDPHQ